MITIINVRLIRHVELDSASQPGFFSFMEVVQLSKKVGVHHLWDEETNGPGI